MSISDPQAGGWRSLAAMRPGQKVNALVAIQGRVRRVGFAEPTLNALQEALSKQPGVSPETVHFRVAANPEGTDHVVTDEQLERLVKAGRPLHVLQEECVIPTTQGTCPEPIPSDGSIQGCEKASSELRQLGICVEQILKEEAELASEVFHGRQRCVALEGSVQELRQRLQAELTLEREAREAGEGELRRFAESLHKTTLGVVTRLEQQVASIQVQAERSSVALNPDGSPEQAQLLKAVEAAVGGNLAELELGLRKGIELMLAEKMGTIEQAIRKELMEATRTAHTELRTAFDASRLLSEQQGANRHGELEAKLVQRFAVMDQSAQKVELLTKQNTCHLETVVKYVSAMHQDSTRHDAEIKEVQKSVRVLRDRTKAAVDGALGLLAEAQGTSGHSSQSPPPAGRGPSQGQHGQSPVGGQSALAHLAPLSSLKFPKPLDLLPGLPEMTADMALEDEWAGMTEPRCTSPTQRRLTHEELEGEQPSAKVPTLAAQSVQSSRAASTDGSSAVVPSTPPDGPAAAADRLRHSTGTKETHPNAARSPPRRTGLGPSVPVGNTRHRSMLIESTGSVRLPSEPLAAGQVRMASCDTMYPSRSMPPRSGRSAMGPAPYAGAVTAANPLSPQSAGRVAVAVCPTGGTRQSTAEIPGGPRQPPVAESLGLAPVVGSRLVHGAANSFPNRVGT